MFNKKRVMVQASLDGAAVLPELFSHISCRPRETSTLKKPTDLDLHCLPFSTWNRINNLHQVIWLADNKWSWHLNLFSMTRVKLFESGWLTIFDFRWNNVNPCYWPFWNSSSCYLFLMGLCGCSLGCYLSFVAVFGGSFWHFDHLVG